MRLLITAIALSLYAPATIRAQVATASPGPFGRSRDRELTISFMLTRQAVFPSDGLSLARKAVIDRVVMYGLGEQLWANDILSAVEGIGGTRVMALSIQYGGVDVSGVNPPLDGRWTVSEENINIMIV